MQKKLHTTSTDFTREFTQQLISCFDETKPIMIAQLNILKRIYNEYFKNAPNTLKNPFIWFIQTQSYNFPIVYYAFLSRNRDDIINYLIDNGLDINTVYDNGDTLLHYACQHYSLLIINTLIHIGVNAKIASKGFDFTALHIFIRSLSERDNLQDCDFETLENLCKISNINNTHALGYTALHDAIIKKAHINVITILLNYGANPNIKGLKDGKTPIMISKNKKITNLLKSYINKKKVNK